MIDSSFTWAASNGLVRKNRVHGEDEAKLILEETFSAEVENGESMQTTGTAECEDMGMGQGISHIYIYTLPTGPILQDLFNHLTWQDVSGDLFNSDLIPDAGYPVRPPTTTAADAELAVKEATAAMAASNAGKQRLECK